MQDEFEKNADSHREEHDDQWCRLCTEPAQNEDESERTDHRRLREHAREFGLDERPK